MPSLAPDITPINTYCPACDQDGLTAWDEPPGFTMDAYLDGLRRRCPDCGAAGRIVTVLDEPPDAATNPELAAMWDELVAFVAADPQRTNTKVGRNEPCPCGSGRKYKRCCG